MKGSLPPPSSSFSLSLASLSFSGVAGGADPAPQTVTMTNTGDTALSWSASADTSSWLGVSPAAGSLAPNSSVALTVSASTAGLSAGPYDLVASAGAVVAY